MKKVIHNPHDKFFRRALSDPRVAKEFFSFHLPPAIKNSVNLDSLQLRKDSYIDEHLKLSLTDMLFSVSFQKRPGYLYTLVEHQSIPDKLMPFRILKYMIAIMEQHLKTTQKAQLPLVYPVLFYTGANAYPYSTNLLDLFVDPDGIAKEILFKPFQLIDISQISDEKLKQNLWCGIMELCMKHVYERDILPFLQDVLILLQQAEELDGADYVRTALTYLLVASEFQDKEKFIKTIEIGLSPETGDAIMTMAQQFEAKGRIEGFAKGRAEGLAVGEIETKKNIARKLLQQGHPIELICQLTDLAQNEIEELA